MDARSAPLIVRTCEAGLWQAGHVVATVARNATLAGQRQRHG